MIESLVAYVFTLHLKACDHTKFNLNLPLDEFQGPS